MSVATMTTDQFAATLLSYLSGWVLTSLDELPTLLKDHGHVLGPELVAAISAAIQDDALDDYPARLVAYDLPHVPNSGWESSDQDERLQHVRRLFFQRWRYLNLHLSEFEPETGGLADLARRVRIGYHWLRWGEAVKALGSTLDG